ncbi:MAG: hypothetical protein ABH869_07225 [Candidatus Omnitrophota bacterium]
MLKLKEIIRLLMCCIVLTAWSVAFAQEEGSLKKEMDALKKEFENMKVDYEKKINELEARLDRNEGAHKQDMGHGRKQKDVHEQSQIETHRETEHKHQHGVLGNRVKLIGALDGRFHNFENQKNSLFIHEAVLGAQADITDWLFANITFSKHHGEDPEIEEGYALFRFEEADGQVKAGKFFVDFGPENTAHFFDRRTIMFSAMHQGMFGEESWKDTGGWINWRVPVDFYSDISFSVVNGNNAESFGDGTDEISNNNMPIVAHFTNGFDTLCGYFRIGNSFSWGTWDADSEYDVFLVGGDAYYCLKGFELQAELIYRYKEQPGLSGEENAYGYYILGAYNVPLEWKYLENLEFLVSFGQFIPDTGTSETKYAPQISFQFNDFTKLRAAYEFRSLLPGETRNNRFIAQLALEF